MPFFRLLPIFPARRVTGCPWYSHPSAAGVTSAAGTYRPRASVNASARMYPWLNSRPNGSVVLATPTSYSTLWKNLAYSRCSTACSTPPTYRSTPVGRIQNRSASAPTSAVSLNGSR